MSPAGRPRSVSRPADDLDRSRDFRSESLSSPSWSRPRERGGSSSAAASSSFFSREPRSESSSSLVSFEPSWATSSSFEREPSLRRRSSLVSVSAISALLPLQSGRPHYGAAVSILARDRLLGLMHEPGPDVRAVLRQCRRDRPLVDAFQ